MNFDGYADGPKIINFEEAKGKRKTEQILFEKGIDDENFYFDQASYEEAEKDYINYITSASLTSRIKDRAIKRIENMQLVLFFMLLLDNVILFTLWLTNLQ